jgi:hypothetical protein
MLDAAAFKFINLVMSDNELLRTIAKGTPFEAELAMYDRVRAESWLRKMVTAEPEIEAMDALTTDFLLQTLETGLNPRRFSPSVLSWTNAPGPLATYLRYSAYNLLGKDRAVFDIPIIVVPAPLFHAEARLLRGGHKIILVNARLCRVVARLVDLVFVFNAKVDAAQREDVARRICELARFAATGDPSALDGGPHRLNRPESAQRIYPFSRNILIFVVLHEHGHFRLKHHARIKEAPPEKTPEMLAACEIEADRFAFATFSGVVSGVTTEPLGGFIALLFEFYRLCEAYGSKDEEKYAPSADTRLQAIRETADPQCAKGIHKVTSAFDELRQIARKRAWLPNDSLFL